MHQYTFKLSCKPLGSSTVQLRSTRTMHLRIIHAYLIAYVHVSSICAHLLIYARLCLFVIRFHKFLYEALLVKRKTLNLWE